ncbi:RING finger protein 10 isoform X2 [Macadamia integrifolia]|uniref:RING finger protein 10 isoform X2 n=1 Tax=Macadamia integrifolia TaxID=60698 RepID=UPI001C4FE8A2|nr:RING finger protein 10 isoform X2 [Macadamia integrifolia]
MSISPTCARRSTPTSSQAFSQDPTFDHGLLPLPTVSQLSESPISVSNDTRTLGTMEIVGGEYSSRHPTGVSGSLAEAKPVSGESSKKVTNFRTPDSKRNLSHQNHGVGSSSRGSSVVRGKSSQLRGHQRGSSQPNGQLPGANCCNHSPPSNGSVGFQGTSTHSAVRKNQMMNANHLLNFHYDPISRPQPRIPPPRRQQKIKPYNKDLFIQANFKFVVLDTGSHDLDLMDPDKMLDWEDVVCVRFLTPFSVQCPICLESPLCPQITSCGHIFCFPCILRYLMMGEEDHKGDCWKKCPLCFMMISSKDLYTIYIDNVKQYHDGDHVKFVLLTRPKDSLIPSHKNKLGKEDSTLCSNDELCDSFSKFTLASDVDLSVREAKSELDGWLARAESGLVDDLEKLPYVCAALEQLEQRKNFWSVRRACSSSSPLKKSVTPNSRSNTCKYEKTESLGFLTVNADSPADSEAFGPASVTPVGFKNELKWPGSLDAENLDVEDYLVQIADMPESSEGQEKELSSSYDESNNSKRHSYGSRDVKEKDSYTFYQVDDGQHLILHPLNLKCLLHYYGGYDLLPSRISGKILQLENVTQSEAMRRRYRYLSHFSLTTTFQLCEIDLSEMLPPDALSPFKDEIRKRENQRKRIAKKELEEKVKAEAAAIHAMPIPVGLSTYHDTTYSMDDFEALGSSSVASSPPVVGEGKRFSDVTRLGFAAGYDSPSLKVEECTDSLSNTSVMGNASGLTGPRGTATQTFANIISAAKSADSVEVPKMNGFGKKGKKPSRVLLSTAGGRRY